MLVQARFPAFDQQKLLLNLLALGRIRLEPEISFKIGLCRAVILLPNHFARAIIDATERHGATVIYGSPVQYEWLTACESPAALSGGTVSETGAGSLFTTELRASAAGAVTLTAANDVGILAGGTTTAGAHFFFNTLFGLLVGTVDGTSGIGTTDGVVFITTANGDLTVTQDVSAGVCSTGQPTTARQWPVPRCRPQSRRPER